MGKPIEPGNREDMFPEGRFKSKSSWGGGFDQNSPAYRYLKKLSELREKYPALSLGAQYIRWSDGSGPGIYAFSRIHEGHEVVVLLNTSGKSRKATPWVDTHFSSPGTLFIDALHPGYELRAHSSAEGGSKLAIEIPPYGVRVLVRQPDPSL
jgi:glycosidase